MGAPSVLRPQLLRHLPSTAKIFSCSCFWMLPSAAKLFTLNTWSREGAEPIVSSSCLAARSWKAPPTCAERKLRRSARLLPRGGGRQVQAEPGAVRRESTHPNGIADDAGSLGLGDDITVLEGVFVLLSIRDNNEDLLGTFAGPVPAVK